MEDDVLKPASDCVRVSEMDGVQLAGRSVVAVLKEGEALRTLDRLRVGPTANSVVCFSIRPEGRAGFAPDMEGIRE